MDKMLFLSYHRSSVTPIAQIKEIEVTPDGIWLTAEGSCNRGEFSKICDRLEGREPLKSRIKQVIFNYPATIVYWNDNTKTVVKCRKNDTFDPEKGLAMAISKKFLGNDGNYHKVFREKLKTAKYIPPKEKHSDEKPKIETLDSNDIFDTDTVVKIYDRNKYGGKLYEKIGYVRNINVFGDHVQYEIDVIGMEPNKYTRSTHGLYLIDANYVVKYVKTCRECKHFNDSFDEMPCNDCLDASIFGHESRWEPAIK